MGVLAAELGGRNIRVNTIAPGPVDTEGTRAAGLIGSRLETQLVVMTPLGRLASRRTSPELPSSSPPMRPIGLPEPGSS